MEGAATVRAGRRGRRLAAALPLLALALACAGPAGPGAASAPTAAGASLDRCDSDTAGRLRFLEQRVPPAGTEARWIAIETLEDFLMFDEVRRRRHAGRR